MDPLVFECVWNNPSAPEVARVQELWRRFGAIQGEDAVAKRSKEVVYVVMHPDGTTGGVSTARAVRVPFLNNHFFYEFRCFISPDFRAPGLDSLLAVKTKQFLETLPGSPAKFKGVLMVVESEDLKTQRTKAVWPASGMVFVGYDSKGRHIRVGYFKGARI